MGDGPAIGRPGGPFRGGRLLRRGSSGQPVLAGTNRPGPAPPIRPAEFAHWPGSATVLFARRAPPGGRRPQGRNADVAQLVEHHLAKVRVAGSNPVVRSETPNAVGNTERFSGSMAGPASLWLLPWRSGRVV